MTIFNIYIFDREGQCLYYDEWFRTKQSGLPPIQEYQLVFGMMLSMKSFSERLSTNDSNQTVNSFRTSAYKMNFLESATGVKILLNSDPAATGMPDLLQKIYQAWVETVNSPVANLLGEGIDHGFLQSKIRDVVTKHPAYV
ncbi:unnamed protein product [Caenorhabditis auriculariae]|uniref:Trafficking protein particle complex subunit n=1 Tax=Caenorhabditis auriculariae TaxID=2777116 RepID=A0A8S1HAI4_9PELO|nr:unnamed protein product [Caenorhabditis auriculariae]